MACRNNNCKVKTGVGLVNVTIIFPVLTRKTAIAI